MCICVYVYKRLPFGTSVSSSIFINVINEVLEECDYTYVQSYVDDIKIFHDHFHKHLEILFEVLSHVYEAGITLNIDKSELFVQRTKFLGFTFTTDGIEKEPSNLKFLNDMELIKPTNKKAVQQLLGHAQYYSRFIENFAEIVGPLQALTHKKSRFFWGDDQEKAVMKLRDEMRKGIKLYYVDFEIPFRLELKVIVQAFSLAITQKPVNRIDEVIITYYSHKFTVNENTYLPTEKIICSVYLSLKKYRSLGTARI